jgi:hypothetical protein
MSRGSSSPLEVAIETRHTGASYYRLVIDEAILRKARQGREDTPFAGRARRRQRVWDHLRHGSAMPFAWANVEHQRRTSASVSDIGKAVQGMDPSTVSASQCRHLPGRDAGHGARALVAPAVGPVTLALAGIAGLAVAIGAFAYLKWDAISGFVKDLAGKIGEGSCRSPAWSHAWHRALPTPSRERSASVAPRRQARTSRRLPWRPTAAWRRVLPQRWNAPPPGNGGDIVLPN